jgi:hypothetical protein
VQHEQAQHVLGELYYQRATPLEEDEGLTMPNYDPKDNFFLQLVHVALIPKHQTVGVFDF